jgi:hypothetical protein
MFSFKLVPSLNAGAIIDELPVVKFDLIMSEFAFRESRLAWLISFPFWRGFILYERFPNWSTYQ